MAVYWLYAYVGYALTKNRMKKLDSSIVKKILSLHRKGKSEREIAREVGCSRGAVWGHLRKAAAAMAVALVFVVPSFANAAIYEYVNTAGALRQVEASSLAEAEVLATDRAANSGFIVSNAATLPAQTSTVGDTVASLLAQIAALQAQLADLLAQQEGSAAPTGDDITEGMGNASSTPPVKSKSEQRVERSAKKEEVKSRGVAIAKAHVYAEEDKIFISLADFVEGDDVGVSAKHEGLAVGDESSETNCGGKVAGSDLKLCSMEVVYPAPEEGVLVVEVEVEGVAKTYSIGRGGKNAWLSWD